MSEWRPIETYPPCDVCGKPDCDWGPTALLLLPSPASEPYAYVGHKEAGRWLVREASDPDCWDELAVAPSHWAPLPSPTESGR